MTSSAITPTADSGPDLAPAVDRTQLVASAVAEWKRELLQLGGSDALLRYQDLPEGTLDLTAAHPSGLAMLLTGRTTRLSTLIREPGALADARRRVRAIRMTAREVVDEQGLGSCWLAVGMAHWADPQPPPREGFPPNSRAERFSAPVLLRACTLHPVGSAGEDADIELAEQVRLNPALADQLAQQHGIDLAQQVSPDLAVSRNRFDPGPVLTQVARIAKSLPGFTVDHRLIIGNFGYSGPTLAADLHRAGPGLAEQPLVAAFAGDPSSKSASAQTLTVFGDLDPESERLVLDADQAQQAAIQAVLAGSNLVLHGPPGTGKSQTIANLIAALAATGRRTLFVAEKRAALAVVQRRLQRVGLAGLLADFSQEPPSAAALAQRVVKQLSAAPIEPAGPGPSAEIQRCRDALAGHIRALHEIRKPWGVSADQAQRALTELTARQPAPRSRIRIKAPYLAALDSARLAVVRADVLSAAQQGVFDFSPQRDPWFAAQLKTSREVSEARRVVQNLHQQDLPRVLAEAERVLGEVGLPQPVTWAEVRERIMLLGAVRLSLELFAPQVFDAVIADQVAATASSRWREEHGVPMTWWQRQRLLGQVRKLLRPGAPPQDVHQALAAALEQRQQWQRLAGPGARPQLPAGLAELERQVQQVNTALEWLLVRLVPADLPSSGLELGPELLTQPVAELRNFLATLAAHDGALPIIPSRVALLDRLQEVGLAGLIADLATREVPAAQVAAEVDLVWWTSVLAHIGRTDPGYGRHDGPALREIQQQLGPAERRQQAVLADRVRTETRQRVRHAAQANPSQEAAVRAMALGPTTAEVAELLAVAPKVLAAAFPCWVMSPLAVAQILPDAESPAAQFDVVVIDESSQVATAHTIAAIRRSRQVVVVGDSQQLQPRRPRGQSAPQSLLAAAAGIFPGARLQHHYRAYAPELFAFANRFFYQDQIHTWAAVGQDRAVELVSVDGRGMLSPGSDAVDSTEAEVRRVVELVLAHAREYPRQSLGVLALNDHHARRLADALRLTLAEFPHLATQLAQGSEPFTVKTVDRAQGDEWDTVLLSLGYGKTAHGRVLHRFGMISEPGGEQLLNVAMTRARRRLKVIAAFSVADLDLERLSTPGAKLLPAVLTFAASGGQLPPLRTQTSMAAVTDPEPPPLSAPQSDSPNVADGEPGTAGVLVAEPLAPLGPKSAGPEYDAVLVDFVDRLRACGLNVDGRCGPTAIDISVAHPQLRTGLAIGWDGPNYAAKGHTRERDRLHREQLEQRGWRYLQLWSTDVFRDPELEVARVVAELGVPEQAEPAGTDSLGLSADDTDLGWGEAPVADHEQWLLEQRPPHWDD